MYWAYRSTTTRTHRTGSKLRALGTMSAAHATTTPTHKPPKGLFTVFLLGCLAFSVSVLALASLTGRNHTTTQSPSSARRLAINFPPPKAKRSGRLVWWFAPFFSGSGMGMEALQLVLGLQQHTQFAGRWVKGVPLAERWYPAGL
jgi:hypothetical protein